MSQCHDVYGPAGAGTVNADGHAFDLAPVTAHLTSGRRNDEDSQREIVALVATVRALEEHQAAATRLIKLAIDHGISGPARDRLDDALVELAWTDAR
ncbi:MAG TPA: hypothetical protein VME46_12785 [Acidimicrobiales bacterium]|nr:hypothetical protein [Acidimicrobiales bacterium]